MLVPLTDSSAWFLQLPQIEGVNKNALHAFPVFICQKNKDINVLSASQPSPRFVSPDITIPKSKKLLREQMWKGSKYQSFLVKCCLKFIWQETVFIIYQDMESQSFSILSQTA